jgi:hypothetical protein
MVLSVTPKRIVVTVIADEVKSMMKKILLIVVNGYCTVNGGAYHQL